jgi:hypothetical protein
MANTREHSDAADAGSALTHATHQEGRYIPAVMSSAVKARTARAQAVRGHGLCPIKVWQLKGQQKALLRRCRTMPDGHLMLT